MRKGKEKKRKKRGLSKARSVLYPALKKKKKKPGLQLSYLERPICQPPSQESRTRTSPANQRIDPGDRNGRSSLLLLPLPSSKQTPKDRPLGHRPSLSHHHNNNHHHNHILSSSSQRSRLPWTVLDRDPFIVVSPTNRRTEGRDGTGRLENRSRLKVLHRCKQTAECEPREKERRRRRSGGERGRTVRGGGTRERERVERVVGALARGGR